ncbi:hypothetical protein IC582_004372 [Cucumis melo]
MHDRRRTWVKNTDPNRFYSGLFGFKITDYVKIISSPATLLHFLVFDSSSPLRLQTRHHFFVFITSPLHRLHHLSFWELGLPQAFSSFLVTFKIFRFSVKPWKREMAAASFRWILQLHKDVPKAARFYSEGLDFTVNVCTLRWAELQSGPLKLALMQSNDHIVQQKGYSSLLSFTVTDINSTVTKLMAMGAELDGSIKYEIHGKVASMRCIDGHMLGLYEPA